MEVSDWVSKDQMEEAVFEGIEWMMDEASTSGSNWDYL